MSLTGIAIRADDLVQETLLKAWSNQHRFQVGSNLNAWLFTILRNHFYSECRKHKREVEDVDGVAAERLTALPDQEDRIELQDVWSKLAKLPALQREARLLVSLHEMTYEAAAEVIGCQVGTVKSRVCRGRALLSDLLSFADGRLSRATA
jgi:RNA polymerase sigma-70 factor (ECF subfamily)